MPRDLCAWLVTPPGETVPSLRFFPRANIGPPGTVVHFVHCTRTCNRKEGLGLKLRPPVPAHCAPSTCPSPTWALLTKLVSRLRSCGWGWEVRRFGAESGRGPRVSPI